MKAHPAADLFPLMQGAEFEALVRDIAEHGLREAIVLHEDQILDGRNRYRACEQAGVKPRFAQWDGKGSPVAYVISLNLKRRHLDETQRAMIGARAEPMFAEEAALRVGGRPAKGTANLPEVSKGEAREKAAQQVNVSPRSVQAAKTVLADGTPELVAACDAGKVAVSVAATLAREPKEKQRRVVEAVTTGKAKNATEALRSERLAERHARNAETAKQNQAAPASERQYSVICSDPPWRYEHAVSTSREIEEQYPTLSLDEIKRLKIGGRAVPDCATTDAILFLWATSPKLAEAMEVIVAWGFTYRTCAVWDKEKIGMGYYFRQQHELLLVATRGNPPAPPADARVASVFRERRGEHSAKPDCVYVAIESMYPEAARLEMFARGPRPGWDVWGNEAKTSVAA